MNYKIFVCFEVFVVHKKKTMRKIYIFKLYGKKQ